MKVLVVTNMYPREGAPYYGVFVRDQVEALRQAGVDVDVFVIEGWRNWREYLACVPRLRKRIDATAPDVIHAHHGYSAWTTKRAVLKSGLAIPWVVTLHDGDLFATQGVRPSHRITRSPRLMVVAKADAVIVVNEDHKPAARRLVHLPCGVDIERFQPGDRKQARARITHPPPRDAKIVFFPADPARPEKRFDRAKEAVELVRARGANATLVTGGNIAPGEIADYYNAADAIVLMSDYEASPMVLKEALACEAPIISLRVGDAAAVLAGVGGATLCAPDIGEIAWAIHRAFRDPRPSEGRARLKSLGITMPQVIERLMDLYEEVIRDAHG